MDDIWADRTGQKYLYRYRPPSIYAIHELMFRQLFIQSRNKLNDLFEDVLVFNEIQKLNANEIINLIRRLGDNQLIHKLQFIFVNNPVEAERYLDQFINEKKQIIRKVLNEAMTTGGVCSFSKKAMSATMFAHYSLNSGFLLAFSREKLGESLGIDDEYFHDVVYSSKPSEVDFNEFLAFAFDKDFSGLNKVLEKYLASKYEDWRYEEEVRIIYPTNGGNLVSYGESLVGVCLAPNSEQAMKDVVLRLCEMSKIPVYEPRKSGEYDYDVLKVQV